MPPAVRVAFGAVLNISTDSKEESGVVLRKMVPSFQLDKSATDISLQFNVSKKLPKISGIVLNRLSKYSQMMSQFVVFDGVTQEVTRSHVLQLELDINTLPDYRIPGPSIYSGLVPAIFAEAESLVL